MSAGATGTSFTFNIVEQNYRPPTYHRIWDVSLPGGEPNPPTDWNGNLSAAMRIWAQPWQISAFKKIVSPLYHEYGNWTGQPVNFPDHISASNNIVLSGMVDYYNKINFEATISITPY